MGGNRIPGPGQCNDGDASTDDGFEEVFSPPTLLFAGAPATLCGTKRRHSHVTAYVNTYNDPALYGATLNIYAKTQNARALIGTTTLSAVAAIAAQAQSFTPNPDTNACDGFDLELVATAGQPVLKTTGSLVAHGWEACCSDGGRGGGIDNVFDAVQTITDASTAVTPNATKNVLVVLLGLSADRAPTMPAAPHVGQRFTFVDGDGSLGSGFTWAIGGNGHTINNLASFVLAATTIAASPGGGIGPRGSITFEYTGVEFKVVG